MEVFNNNINEEKNKKNKNDSQNDSNLDLDEGFELKQIFFQNNFLHFEKENHMLFHFSCKV